jgi:hypothetical protein
VQVLSEEEHIATDDIIVAVKLVIYMDANGQSCNGSVSNAIDVPMQRTSKALLLLFFYFNPFNRHY